jgi:hypothetical protein
MKIPCKSKSFFGAGDSLAYRIQKYFTHVKMAPGMIRSFRITASEKTGSSPASVTIKILHRVNTNPTEKHTACRVVVFHTRDTTKYDSTLEMVVNDTEEHLWFHDEIQDSDGTHYWIGVFAPEV